MTYSTLLSQIHKLAAEIKKPDQTEISHLVQRQKQHRKWLMTLEYVRLRPFRVNQRQPRSGQWQDAMNEVRELRDQEIIDWLWQQSDIARNHERGIQDMRPPRKGTCHEALVEYLHMRERKAMRVLEWEEAAQKEGCFRVNSEFHARTREILDQHAPKEEKPKDRSAHEFQPDEPWIRS